MAKSQLDQAIKNLVFIVTKEQRMTKKLARKYLTKALAKNYVIDAILKSIEKQQEENRDRMP